MSAIIFFIKMRTAQGHKNKKKEEKARYSVSYQSLREFSRKSNMQIFDQTRDVLPPPCPKSLK